MPQKETVGSRLTKARKSLDLKSYQFAHLIKISQGSFSDQENDKMMPSAKTLTGIALFTNINLHWLLTGLGSIERFPDEFVRPIKKSKIW